MQNPQGQIVTVGVTGASGAILAQAALRMLDADARVSRVHVVVTLRLFAQELGIVAADARQQTQLLLGRPASKVDVCRVLAQIGLPQQQQYRWTGGGKTRAQEV